MASPRSPESPWTRLIHIPTGAIPKHELDHLPIYLAVSHTWYSGLFPSDQELRDSLGFKIIESLKRTEHKDVEYCWIDTLCIDQYDDLDKQRQIPWMGHIYQNAQVVLIALGERLGLTQARLDAVVRSVQGAVEMWKNEDWQAEGARWQAPKHRQRLQSAMDCLEVFTRSAWGTRVWTMQEFVLARATVWIGTDLQPVTIPLDMFSAIPIVCSELNITSFLGPKYQRLFDYFQGMASAQAGQIEPTRVMELLGHRQASVPEDCIYGAMAASSVVLDDVSIKGPDRVWSLWWAKAIANGHVRWAFLPPTMGSQNADAEAERRYRNCIMPPFSVRHTASANSTLDSVKPYGASSISDGTLSIEGKLVGRCTIPRKLGRCIEIEPGRLARDITLIIFAAGSWPLALRIAAAFGGGRYNANQRLEIAQVLTFNFHRAELSIRLEHLDTFKPRFRSQRQLRIWSDFMELQSTQMMIMNYGIAYLTTVNTHSGHAADIILVTTEDGPLGDIVDLDFVVSNGSERTLMTVVQESKMAAQTASTAEEIISQQPSLHRVGVAMPTIITHDLSKAERYACPVVDFEEPLQSYDIGGRRCIICSKSKAVKIQSEIAAAKGKEDPGGDKAMPVKTLWLRMLKDTHALKTRWRKRRRYINQV